MPLNLAMEWASPAGARSVDLFDFQEKDFPNLQFEQLVFPRSQLPLDIKCSKFRVIRVARKTYLPLDSLLIALYERKDVQRWVFDVLRDLDERASITLSHDADYPTGLLVPEVEAQGFRLKSIFNIEELDVITCHIGWQTKPRAHLIHACMVDFSASSPLGDGKWADCGVVCLIQLLTRELQRIVGKPVQLFTEKGKSYLRTNVQTFVTAIDTPEGRIELPRV